MAFLMDKYLPLYHYHEYHERLIQASAKTCFKVVKNIDLNDSWIIKALLKLRCLPVKDLTLQGFLQNICFTYVEEKPPKEFVIDASTGDLKIFWNFYFKEVEYNKTLVSTETRIFCLNRRSKVFFSIYWFVVKPFSGITRIEMLRLVRKKAESKR